jgi:hypothetical protein
VSCWYAQACGNPPTIERSRRHRRKNRSPPRPALAAFLSIRPPTARILTQPPQLSLSPAAGGVGLRPIGQGREEQPAEDSVGGKDQSEEERGARFEERVFNGIDAVSKALWKDRIGRVRALLIASADVVPFRVRVGPGGEGVGRSLIARADACGRAGQGGRCT